VSPLVLYFDPTLFGLFKPWPRSPILPPGCQDLLAIGLAACCFRTIHCSSSRRGDGSRLVTKILTDPFHDLKLYHKAPLFLLKVN